MKIFIDPGHNYSGYDTGAAGNGLKEQDVTYQIGVKVKDNLLSNGIEVKMSRNSMYDNIGVSLNDSLNKRAKMANDWGADYFVSIHCNAGGGMGVETYAYSAGGEGEKLAKAVQAELIKLPLVNRGVKFSNFAVLRNTNMPAILIETAFIDNSGDAELLRNRQGDFANSISDGILNYLGIEKKKGNDSMSKNFSDISGHYAEKHIKKLADYGIVNGYEDGTFRPDEPITRGQAAIMVANALTICGK